MPASDIGAGSLFALLRAVVALAGGAVGVEVAAQLLTRERVCDGDGAEWQPEQG
jgi:hypothetical protein